jgi:hypothetical protein
MINSILEPQTLLKLYTRFGGAVADPFAPYFPAQPNPNPGDKVGIEVYDYTRKAAGVNVRGGDPQKTKPPTRTIQVAAGLTLSEALVIPPRTIKDLRAPGDLLQANGRAEVARRMLELRKRIDTRKVILHSQAMKGTLSFTLPDAVSQTVDLGMSADHKPSSVAASWAVAGTDIIAQLMAYKVQAIQDTGIPLARMYMNTATSMYLLNNTAIKAFWAGLPQAMSVLTTGELPPIVGLQPVIVDDGYISDAGTYTPYLADKEVILAPNPAQAMSADIECEPVSLMAPEGMRGLYFNTIEPTPGSAHINEGITVEYEYTFLTTLGAEPDAFFYLADVTDIVP